MPKQRQRTSPADLEPRVLLLYHYCRLQLPSIVLGSDRVGFHLHRTHALHLAKDSTSRWEEFLDKLYPLDWYLACACLEGVADAWNYLFAARAGRSDCLLVDALRARAVRLYPRDEERQESAVTEFWSHLLVAGSAGSLPVLARYDGQRPLVPWLIRVFQNWHISILRQRSGAASLPDDNLTLPPAESADARWREAFCQAARESMEELNETELLILGLRLRYRLSQREVASILGVHEGTISRQTAHLRDRVLEAIGRRMATQGWSDGDLSELVMRELGGVLLDDPRLSADQLALMLTGRGKALPADAV